MGNNVSYSVLQNVHWSCWIDIQFWNVFYLWKVLNFFFPLIERIWSKAPVLSSGEGWLTCEQALRGVLALSGAGTERELATTSPEFKYIQRKNRCEMLIGGYDNRNGVITLGTCFSMFVYLHVRFRFSFALIGGNLTTHTERVHWMIDDYSFFLKI